MIEARLANAVGLAVRLAPIGNNCDRYFLDAVCHNYFMLASTTALAFADLLFATYPPAGGGAGYAPRVVLPRRPCRSLCSQMRSACNPLIAALVARDPVGGQAVNFNCTSRGSFTGGPTVTCAGTVTNPGLPDFPEDDPATGAFSSDTVTGYFPYTQFLTLQGQPVRTSCAGGSTSRDGDARNLAAGAVAVFTPQGACLCLYAERAYGPSVCAECTCVRRVRGARAVRCGACGGREVRVAALGLQFVFSSHFAILNRNRASPFAPSFTFLFFLFFHSPSRTPPPPTNQPTNGAAMSMSTITTGLCMPPLVYPDTYESQGRINGGACATPCPSLAFTEDEYSQVDIAMIVAYLISAICSTFMFLTWAVFPIKRKQFFVLVFLFGKKARRSTENCPSQGARVASGGANESKAMQAIICFHAPFPARFPSAEAVALIATDRGWGSGCACACGAAITHTRTSRIDCLLSCSLCALAVRLPPCVRMPFGCRCAVSCVLWLPLCSPAQASPCFRWATCWYGPSARTATSRRFRA